MNRILTLFILTLPFWALNQTELTNEERVYLFHTVKKSPILNEKIGLFFDYLGPEIRISADELNYDSIEQVILAQPELLVIRTDEIKKSEKGLVVEASNKLALWELNRMVLAKSGDSSGFIPFQGKYRFFEGLFLDSLPEVAIERNTKGEKHLKASILPILNPLMYTNEKIDLLETFRFWDSDDRLNTLKIIQRATSKYVAHRTLEIFTALGGEQTSFRNLLMAAGDGVISPEKFEEREKDEKNRWTKGLPKAVGFFPYSLVEREATYDNERTLQTSNFEVVSLSTTGENRMTKVHFDVWGFNPKRQMTVIIEKNGMQYPLFGKLDSRFLSPDSSYGGEFSFNGMMKHLQKDYIDVLHEKIYGRRGYEWAIVYFTAQRDQAEKDLMKAEHEYSDLHMKRTKTKNSVSKAYKKKEKERIEEKKPREENYIDPKRKDGRKQKRTKENEIIYLQGLIEALNAKIKEYQIIRSKGIMMLEEYKSKLYVHQRWFGDKWLSAENKNGIYTFSDGSTFDLSTQDFTFLPTMEKEEFSVRILPVPDSPELNSTDEVMLHLSIIDAVPNQDARIQPDLKGHFEQGQSIALDSMFSMADSVSLMLFFQHLIKKEYGFKITATGNGIGIWNGCRLVSSPSGNSSNNEGPNLNTDATHLYVHLGRNIDLLAESFVDGKEFSEATMNTALLAYAGKYSLNKFELVTACRSAAVLRQFKSEVMAYATRFLPADQLTVVASRLEKTFKSAKIQVGATVIPLSKF
jgi:hypothetical protein